MAYLQGLFPILKKRNPAKNVFDFLIHCPAIAKAAQAGQIVQVKATGFFLRRPISICAIDRARGNIRLVFEIRGDGTQKLSELNRGDLIDLIGPLGNGFSVDPQKTVVVVGGGIGVPPLLETAKAAGSAVAILGFRDQRAVILEDDFKAVAETIVCTDDGSYGRAGLVTAALKDHLAAHRAELVCACGPAPMLKGVYALAAEHGVPCEVSLEERMGCGVGACLVCACRTVKNGEELFRHVCKDGPVFKGEEVVF